MTPQEIEQYVDDLYAACGAGEWDRAESMLTDDFVAYESDALPMAGAYSGKKGLQNLFVKVMGMIDVAGLDRVVTTVGGDYAVAIITMRFADPDLAPAELCEVFRFRDGKCCEIKPYYYDPAAVHAASQARAGA